MSSGVPRDLATLLAAGGAPPALEDRVRSALGPEAEAVLAQDPWRLLDVRVVRPEQADAYARAVLGGAATDDPRRTAALVTWPVRRAAADGHTAVPATLLRGALAGHGITDADAALEAAFAAGRVVPDARLVTGSQDAAVAGDLVEELTEDLVAGAELAEAEDAVADGLLRLLATAEPWEPPPPDGLGAGDDVLDALRDSGVVLVENSYDAGACDAVRRAGALPGVHAVEHAEMLDVPAAAELVESLPDGTRLVLAGDPLLLPSAGPGRVLGDAAASGALPVVRLEPAATPVAALVGALREGRLPEAGDPGRHVVVLPTTDEHAVGLAVRVVTDSVPRVHGIDPADVVVVSPHRRGTAGADALDEALTGVLGVGPAPRARTVHEARGRRWPAAVVVLPAQAAGLLSRALVATACSLGTRHVSVLAAAGPDLRAAVERVSARPRTTRLTSLLRLG